MGPSPCELCRSVPVVPADTPYDVWVRMDFLCPACRAIVTARQEAAASARRTVIAAHNAGTATPEQEAAFREIVIRGAQGRDKDD